MKLFRWDRVTEEPLSPLFKRQAIHGEKMTVARMHLLKDARGDLHQHPHEQLSFIQSGRLRFFVGDEEKELQTGDILLIPPDTQHGVLALEETVILDIFSPGREDWPR
jgi:quercetin dioxygenase-like cupin family protein